MPRLETKRLAAAGGILGAVLQGDGSNKATSHPPPKQGATYPHAGEARQPLPPTGNSVTYKCSCRSAWEAGKNQIFPARRPCPARDAGVEVSPAGLGTSHPPDVGSQRKPFSC